MNETTATSRVVDILTIVTEIDSLALHMGVVGPENASWDELSQRKADAYQKLTAALHQVSGITK